MKIFALVETDKDGNEKILDYFKHTVDAQKILGQLSKLGGCQNYHITVIDVVSFQKKDIEADKRTEEIRQWMIRRIRNREERWRTIAAEIAMKRWEQDEKRNRRKSNKAI